MRISEFGPGVESFKWLPDGKRIVFVHDPAAEPRLGNPLALGELDLKTSRVKALAQDEAWDFSGPRYSPDGQQIAAMAAFVGQFHTAHNQLVLIDLQQPRRERRVRDALWPGSVEAPLRWSADAGANYFSAEARGRCHL